MFWFPKTPVWICKRSSRDSSGEGALESPGPFPTLRGPRLRPLGSLLLLTLAGMQRGEAFHLSQATSSSSTEVAGGALALELHGPARS